MSHLKNYLLIIATLVGSYFISMGAARYLNSTIFMENAALKMLPVFLDIVIVLALGFTAYELAKPTIIPSFVLAILFGFVAQPSLTFLTQNPFALFIFTMLGAIFILFGGGLDTPFVKFRAQTLPILSIAFVGTLLTAFLFSHTLFLITNATGTAISLTSIILLGAALASTDPAAIIPSFKGLLFRSPRVKYIAISESAINDVVGAVLTGVFLTLFAEQTLPESLLGAYRLFFTFEHALSLGRLLAIGGTVGIASYAILYAWSKWKERMTSEGEADAALFLAVPLLAFTLASALGGSGFLAVFISGLLFQIRSHVQHVEHFFNHTIEGFMKPLIFMMLGALVSLSTLIEFAGIGIAMGLLFMFIIRPIIVFVTLGPFTKGKYRITLKELIFLSFVRETGVIPAMLLVSISAAGISDAEAILAIGMWIILLTLIVQPPLTPILAKMFGIAESMPAFPKPKHSGPVAVLCSRGYSFLERLDTVVDWCYKHAVTNVILLHCPEEKASEDFFRHVEQTAHARFQQLNEKFASEGKKEINFELIGRPGKLEDNIEMFVNENDVSIIFVGVRMLDYRAEEIKHLQAPFYFMP